MRKILQIKTILFFVLLSGLVFAQAGSYYNSISVTSPTFINDLEARIRSPYTRISYDQYDETNVANFASRDTLIGKKVITCVYSGENYVYTPPFAWGHFSREHTWCQSWMPSNAAADFTNRPEYSDQHHLFPANQDNANGIRSNYPEGNVVTVTSTYLLSKFGKDASGNTVFEPRAAHKGNVARALLYMAVRYNGIDGYNWTFNNLNKNIISQNPQDLATLLEWNRQDPPDKWEVDRNNYIQSVQGNRNPFVDHPEYVNYINFNDLTLQTPQFAAEPENQITNISGTTTDSSITLTWTDAAAGAQAPSGYLILAYCKDNYFIPVDGSVYSDDTNLSDGVAVVNVPYSASDSYTFKGLKTASDYYFTVYSYNGTGSQINYNTNNLGVKAKIRTSGTSAPKIYFSSNTATVINKSSSYSLYVSITDPNPISATTVKVALSSGNSSYINNFSSANVTFPAGSTTPQIVPIRITAGALSSGSEVLTFEIQSVAGGGDIQVASPDKFALTIQTGGSEDFSGYPVTGNSYVSGTFKGQDGSTWTYSSCANANPITSPSPVLKKGASPLAKVESGVISGGCGVLSLKYMQPFSTNVNLGVYVNNVLYGTLTTNAETGAIKNSGPINVNVAGNFTIKLEQINSTSAQVTIDDILWTGYGDNTAVDGSQPSAQPKEYSLYQNYPNPFNPETNIAYDLPKDEYVTLKVFNSLGKEVAVLINSSFTSAGHHQVRWNANEFPSGIYILRMQSGGFSSTRKLLLLK